MTIFLYLSFCIIWSFDFPPKNCNFTLYTYLFIHFKLVNSKLSTNQITCLLASCSESTNQRPPLRQRLANTSSGCAETAVYDLVADSNATAPSSFNLNFQTKVNPPWLGSSLEYLETWEIFLEDVAGKVIKAVMCQQSSSRYMALVSHIPFIDTLIFSDLMSLEELSCQTVMTSYPCLLPVSRFEQVREEQQSEKSRCCILELFWVYRKCHCMWQRWKYSCWILCGIEE